MTEEQLQAIRLLERALEAERDAHVKTRNELANERSMRSRIEMTCEALEAQLAAVLELIPVEQPLEVYSCAVCSSKTDIKPIRSVCHPCCRQSVHIGPCCRAALEQSPETVSAILHDCGHMTGCKRNMK